MVIAVNTRLLIDQIHGGIEWFTYEILSRITVMHPEHHFVFVFDRPWDEKFIFSENVEPVSVGPKAIHPLLWYWWNQVSVPPVLRRTGADIYISPDGMIPLKPQIPAIPVIHDLGFVHRPGDLPFLKSAFYRRYFPRYAEAGKRIMTVSRFSADDISLQFGIEKSLIDVVYNGASEEFYPDMGPVTTIIPGMDEERPYFLFVGNLSPRKNVPNMIRAYERYRADNEDNSLLVIAGDRFFLNGELDRVYSKSACRDDIIFTGSMNREQLRRLYSNALALLFVPWFEGFGIPVVEAMRCGTPVIASDSSSLPEISSDAALLVNPDDTEAIAEAMKKVGENSDLRESLVSAGFINAQKFTWEKSAQSFWESVEKVINTK